MSNPVAPPTAGASFCPGNVAGANAVRGAGAGFWAGASTSANFGAGAGAGAGADASTVADAGPGTVAGACADAGAGAVAVTGTGAGAGAGTDTGTGVGAGANAGAGAVDGAGSSAGAGTDAGAGARAGAGAGAAHKHAYPHHFKLQPAPLFPSTQPYLTPTAALYYLHRLRTCAATAFGHALHSGKPVGRQGPPLQLQGFVNAVADRWDTVLAVGFSLGQTTMGIALRLPFMAGWGPRVAMWTSLAWSTGGNVGWTEVLFATIMSPVHVLAWKGLGWGHGNSRNTALTVLAALASGLHMGTIRNFIMAPQWPWRMENIWDLPACEILSVAAVLDLAPPQSGRLHRP
jgi:hypothetical protein